MEVCIGDEQDSDIVKLKKKKPGIIYLGTLPPYMNVTKVKELFSQYGTLGRLFLQPAITKAGAVPCFFKVNCYCVMFKVNITLFNYEMK